MSVFSHCRQDKWEKHADTDKAIDISEDMSLLTLDTILQCAFSYKSNCQTDGWGNFYGSNHQLTGRISWSISFTPTLIWLFFGGTICFYFCSRNTSCNQIISWHKDFRWGFLLFFSSPLFLVSLVRVEAISCKSWAFSGVPTSSETDEYVKAVYTMTDMINVRLTNFPFHNNLIFKICKGLKYRKASQITHTKTGMIQLWPFKTGSNQV